MWRLARHSLDTWVVWGFDGAQRSPRGRGRPRLLMMKGAERWIVWC